MATGCPVFPNTSNWHQDISGLPVHGRSEAIKTNIGGSYLHPDFGGGDDYEGPFVLYGIPNNYVDTSQGALAVPITFDDYADESDPGPYPIPQNASIEGAYPGMSPLSLPPLL